MLLLRPSVFIDFQFCPPCVGFSVGNKLFLVSLKLRTIGPLDIPNLSSYLSLFSYLFRVQIITICPEYSRKIQKCNPVEFKLE